MKNFVSNSAVKIICVLLTPVISYLSVFSIIATILNINENFYSTDETDVFVNSSHTSEEEYKMRYFFQTDQCMNMLTDDAYNICTLFAASENVGNSQLVDYTIDNSNLQVLVYSVKDNVKTSVYFNNRLQIEEGLSTEVEMTAFYDADKTIVTRLVLDRVLSKDDKYRAAYESYYQMKGLRNVFVLSAIFSTLLFIVILIFLCAGVGRKRNSDTVFLNFYNRIPLEIILSFYIAAFIFSARGIANIYMMPYYYDGLKAMLPQAALFSVPPFLIINIVLVPLIVSMAARIKASTKKVLPFWKNFLIIRIIHFLITQGKKAAGFAVKNSSAVFIGALSFILFILANIFLMFLSVNIGRIVLFFTISFNAGVLVFICRFLSNLDRLRKETQALEKGEYTITDSNSYMLFFRKFAESLNHTKEGMSVALEKSIKSERFKTELITNVSHDLKTPLTSIINYVDLMKNENPGSPKSQEYLDILDKQSKRLKKLVEDLIEVSKASTGNIKADLVPIDIEEFLSQVNGEFIEKLENSGLTAVISHSSGNLRIIADGTLLWRVFNNLFTNICKYTLSGTRVYITTVKKGNNAEISVKNISSAPLNIDAQELTERFVRGDSSRNTEGSGLGLSIAKSLTESQNGAFNIEIDGDLFKVILEFPLCYTEYSRENYTSYIESDDILSQPVSRELMEFPAERAKNKHFKNTPSKIHKDINT